MKTLPPAWSELFLDTALATLRPFSPLDDLTPEWAWGGSTGQGVKVGVIDSGIDAKHPAVGKPVSGYVAVSEDASGKPVYTAGPHEDVFGHGTACAAIIRAVAPECELYSIRVLDAELGGEASTFAAGLRWAIENGLHVCNLSLGTTRKEFFAMLHELADLAAFRNVFLVTAANNLPVPSYPSMYASVFSVASSAGDDPYRFYYNPRPPVDFGAPGLDQRVAWLKGSYITATGNSFAAPHITGIVAKILGKHPGLNPAQMKVILRALAANMQRT
jgi:subtilisin